MPDQGILLSSIAEKFNLKNLIPEIDTDTRYVTTSEINRPSLFLTGYFEDFRYERIQIIGVGEYNYFKKVDPERRKDIIDKMTQYDMPCIIFCNNLNPGRDLLDIGKDRGIPVFTVDSPTTTFSSELTRWLIQKLAPVQIVHGVLVEVYGVGVLIKGESGIGKSEAALELIRRGHRLVSDDAVELRKVNGDIIIGESPDVTRYFLELRGIGIIDVKTLYGVESVKKSKKIDLIINLEEWNQDKDYDRTGLEMDHEKLLDIETDSYTIPIRPGRNIAVIVETAAVNYRQREMGYVAAQELYRRLNEKIVNNDQ